MTYQETLKHFNSLQKRYTTEHNGVMCEKVKIAIEAIEKQIPKKQRITHHKYLCNGKEETVDLMHCPICFEHMGYFDSLLNKGTAYCHRCGQAIDWSDDDE